MRYFISAFLLVLAGCSDSPDAPSPAHPAETSTMLFASLEGIETGIQFQNDIVEDDDVNHMVWDACYYGGGVAIGDLNGDDKPDVFFTGNQVDDALYINEGDMKFSDVSESSGISKEAGWSTGVSLADYDGDGDEDIYVCRSGWLFDNEMVDARRNKLWRNNGDGTFTNVATELGLDNEGYGTQSAWFDYDKDGDLDMFLLNAPSNNISQKVKYNSTGIPDYCMDKLFRNDGGAFVDVSEEAGVHTYSFGLGVITVDLNHDGLTDIYVANDYDRPDYFYVNMGDGTFQNQLNLKVKHTCFTAMGVDAGDINNDALLDFAVLDMQPSEHYRSKTNMPSMQPERFWKLVDQGYNYQYMTNVLQVNNGAGFFTDVCQIAGIASTDWSWSVLLQDFDLDGKKDIYVTNGINRDIQNNDFANAFEERTKTGQSLNLLEIAEEAPSTKIPNFAFKNSGDFEFDKVREDWGLDAPSFSYGAAVGDLDGDGDQDLIVNNNNMPPFVYRNDSKGNWLNVKINGPKGNPNGLGVKVVVYQDGEKQFQEITSTRGYQSASQPIASFGLPSAGQVDSLLVFWPDGAIGKQFNVSSNSYVEVDAGLRNASSHFVYGAIRPLFEDVTSQVALDYQHEEDDFDDFEREILLPHRQSRMGPAMATGDVNGDGLEDVFLGGAAGQVGKLYMQTLGGFEMTSELGNKSSEQVDATFLDVDSDGDLDLYVVSGGAHLVPGSLGYMDMLYINDGEGYFNMQKVENTNVNGSCILSADVDGDGDEDVLIGGGVKPGFYPKSAGSVVLINEDGNLVSRTEDVLPGIDLGMVNELIWTDHDGDGSKSLGVVSEWMPVRFYNWNGSGFEADGVNETLADHVGWFYSIHEADVNHDGQPDYVVGNVGLNNKFHPGDDQALKIYGHDFDNNGTNDVVLAKASKEKYVPVRGRECSSEQMPFIAKKFEDYHSFACASLEDIYGEGLEEATHYAANDFSSGVFLSTGSGFEYMQLPNLAQVSSIQKVLSDDFNRDGNTDLLIVGNMFDAEVETTRYDASNGLLLLGDGSGKFEAQNALYSGFYAPMNAKDAATITSSDGHKMVIVANNNQRPSVFKY